MTRLDRRTELRPAPSPRRRRAALGGKIAVGVAACLVVTPAAADLSLEQLQMIDRGFEVFTEETFDGNGRTCKTCHLPEEQYNIYPSVIAKMSPSDKALVLASTVPQLENDTWVLERALFNVEGGLAQPPDDDPGTHGPFFRGSMTVGPLARLDGPFAPFHGAEGDLTTVFGPVVRVGWAGNAAPTNPHHGNIDPDADGTLRAFPNGAIAQHFPKTLARVAAQNAGPGETPDFRFATPQELDDLDIFSQWLGRREQFFLKNRQTDTTHPDFGFEMFFKDAGAEAGKAVYLSNEASCNICHQHGGAGFGPTSTTRVGPNILQHSDVNHEAERLSALTGVFLPEDEGGFIVPPGGGGGFEAFNIQPLIEATRKEIFFHNSAIISTKYGGGDDIEACGGIEGASTFYFREPFTTSEIHTALQGLLSIPANGDRSGNQHIDELDDFLDAMGEYSIAEMGRTLRAMSAFYSLRDCERLIDETIDRIHYYNQGENVRTDLAAMHCGFNLDDVVDVLAPRKQKSGHLGSYGGGGYGGYGTLPGYGAFPGYGGGGMNGVEDPFTSLKCDTGKPLYSIQRFQIPSLKWRMEFAVKKRDVYLLQQVRSHIVALRRSIAYTPELP